MERIQLIAAGLTLLLCAAHSIIGERLIFARLREGGRWSEAALAMLERRRWWAIRATWHLVSILGGGLAAFLVLDSVGEGRVTTTIGLIFLVAALYWAVATRFGHPAWLVMGVIAALLLFPL